jgi:hypothetical protein
VESVTFDVKAGHFLLADLDAFRMGIDNDTAQFSVNSIRRWLSLRRAMAMLRREARRTIAAVR